MKIIYYNNLYFPNVITENLICFVTNYQLLKQTGMKHNCV